jgi:putative membrane protein
MNSELLLKSHTRYLVIFVIIVHLMFFVLEALLWMNPFVYNILLGFLDNKVSLSFPVQALTLKNLFINQGCYNLFLSISGIIGLNMVSRKKYQQGYALILFLCFCGFGAGVTLSLSTKAYLLAIVQAIPAAITFVLVYPLYKMSSERS